MNEVLTLVLTGVLASAGALFCLLAALGVFRMPDLFTRMQAGSKGSTLGVICLLAAAAVHFASGDVALRALLVAVFLMMTAPIAAHMIARAGYLAGAKLSDETTLDELRGRYDKRNRRLK